jgi:hypothetical protein
VKSKGFLRTILTLHDTVNHHMLLRPVATTFQEEPLSLNKMLRVEVVKSSLEKATGPDEC